MKLGEDTFGERPRNTGHACDVLHTRGLHALHATEMREQRFALGGPDPGDFLQRRRGARLGAPRAMPLDREPMRLVAICCNRCSLMIGRKIEQSRP